MKKLIALALSSTICIVSLAQNLRPVQGRVIDVEGTPIQGVTITVKGLGTTFMTDTNGNFRADVPYGYNFLTASFTDYFPKTLEIDGSYLIFKLVYDIEGVKRRVEARAKVVFERIAAEERTRKDAEAKAAAEEAARMEAENERIAAEEKARKEAEAKAAAEKKAKAKAEKKRIAEEARSKRQAMKAEQNKAYDEKFKNTGLAHSIELGYNPGIMAGEVIYKYSGRREYNSLHPFFATYTLSWKFNRSVAIGAGIGTMFNLKSFTIEGDRLVFEDDRHAGFKEIRLDIPAFINIRTWFCRTKVRPFIDVKAGYYCLSGTLAADLGIGCEFRLNRNCSMHVLAGAGFTPKPDFLFGGLSKDFELSIPSFTGTGYGCSLTPSIKIGFDF